MLLEIFYWYMAFGLPMLIVFAVECDHEVVPRTAFGLASFCGCWLLWPSACWYLVASSKRPPK